MSVCTKPADVEEVEPYASYIQRVNSIYNSSAELFNAWETLTFHDETGYQSKDMSVVKITHEKQY